MQVDDNDDYDEYNDGAYNDGAYQPEMMNARHGKMIPASWRLNQMPAIVTIKKTTILVMSMMMVLAMLLMMMAMLLITMILMKMSLVMMMMTMTILMMTSMAI